MWKRFSLAATERRYSHENLSSVLRLWADRGASEGSGLGVVTELDGQHAGALLEWRVAIVAEERAPPLVRGILEEHVVAAMRHGQKAVAIRTHE